MAEEEGEEGVIITVWGEDQQAPVCTPCKPLYVPPTIILAFNSNPLPITPPFPQGHVLV